MSRGFLYLDSSALVKLILPEAESGPRLLQPDLGAVVSYDVRLSWAALNEGLSVLAPA